MMAPFCLEQGTSSHETIMDLASTDEKVMFIGGEVDARETDREIPNDHESLLK